MRASISIPYRPNDEPFARPVPSNAHAAASAPRTTNGPWTPPVVGADVLHADERRLGPPEVAPELLASQLRSVADARGRRSCSPRGTAGCRRVAIALDRRRTRASSRTPSWPGKDDEVVRAPSVGRRAGRARGRRRTGSRPACRCGSATRRTRDPSRGSGTARRSRGTAARRRRCAARARRTSCRPSRHRPRRGSCTPATCSSRGRPRPGARQACADGR